MNGRARVPRFRTPLAAAAAVGLVLGALVVSLATHAFGAVRVDQTVSGEITLVNGPGSAICLNEDSGGAQLCSDVLQRRDDPALTVGEHVTVVRVIVDGKDSLIVLSEEPTPS